MKIFMFDIDGTIIPKCSFEYHPSFNEAVKLIKIHGDLVLINTGRSLYMVQQELRNLFDGMLLGNGSLIIINNEIKFTRYMDSKAVKKVLDYCDANKVAIGVNKIDSLKVLNGVEKASKYEYGYEENEFQYCEEAFYNNFNINDVFCMYGYLEDNEDILGFKKAVEEAGLHFFNSISPCCYDIVDPKVGKEYGLKQIRKMYKDAVIYGFGDGDNDYYFLKECDYSYAMEESNDRLKKVTTETIGKCMSDTIYLKIKEIYGVK